MSTTEQLSFFLLPNSVLKNMHESFQRIVGHKVAALLLYEAGFGSGVETGKHLDLSFLTEDEKREKKINDLGLQIGLGNISLIEFSDESIKLACVDSNEAKAIENSPVPICDLTSGFIAGLFTIGLERPLQAIEVECRAKGDEKCIFHLSSTKRLY